MKILSSFTHPQVVPNLYEFLFFCWTQKKIFSRMSVIKQLMSIFPYYGSQWDPYSLMWGLFNILHFILWIEFIQISLFYILWEEILEGYYRGRILETLNNTGDRTVKNNWPQSATIDWSRRQHVQSLICKSLSLFLFLGRIFWRPLKRWWRTLRTLFQVQHQVKRSSPRLPNLLPRPSHNLQMWWNWERPA